MTTQRRTPATQPLPYEFLQGSHQVRLLYDPIAVYANHSFTFRGAFVFEDKGVSPFTGTESMLGYFSSDIDVVIFM